VIPFVALCVAATSALLVFERREERVGIWIAKPLAASAYIGAALAAGALETPYGRTVLAALALSWLGDVLLIPRGSPSSFRAGLVSFLLGHVVFTAAFVLRGVDLAVCATAGVVAAIVALAILRWLHPFLPRNLARAVQTYVAVISLMVVAAAGTGRAAILVGALMFWASDLAVARERFVASSFWNRAWGLPLYFGGQLVLASTVA
jgi:uncharacterized membrane protein YhhN